MPAETKCPVCRRKIAFDSLGVSADTRKPMFVFHYRTLKCVKLSECPGSRRTLRHAKELAKAEGAA